MPNATYQESHKDIPIVSRLAATVAAQGDVDVLCEPSGQGDMPTLPKVGNAYGKIRSSEVVGQIKTKRPGNADGHQRIARKIAINLQGIK